MQLSFHYIVSVPLISTGQKYLAYLRPNIKEHLFFILVVLGYKNNSDTNIFTWKLITSLYEQSVKEKSIRYGD